MVADCPANCARFSLCLSNFVFIVSCKMFVTRLLDLTYLLCTFMPLLFLLRIPDMVREMFLAAILVGTQVARLHKRLYVVQWFSLQIVSTALLVVGTWVAVSKDTFLGHLVDATGNSTPFHTLVNKGGDNSATAFIEVSSECVRVSLVWQTN